MNITHHFTCSFSDFAGRIKGDRLAKDVPKLLNYSFDTKYKFATMGGAKYSCLFVFGN